MAPRLAMLNRNGQITIPAEYRRALALREGDKVALSLEDGRLVLRPYGTVTNRTAGLLKGPGPVLSAEEMREAAERAIEGAIGRQSGAGVVARTAGIFKVDRPALTAEEERAAFERLVAEEVAGGGER